MTATPTTALPPGVRSLRRALEEHADVISNTAQMVLESLDESGGSELQCRDVSRIYESTLAAYRLVHEKLTVQNFSVVEDETEELQRIRHDLRNLLQNVLLRGQMLVEDEEELPELISSEIEDILKHARLCVEALNASRDTGSGIVKPHRLDNEASTIEPPENLKISDEDLGKTEITEARILIADDNENSRETLGRFLMKEGHTVAEAATGKEALERLDEAEFDLILLDLVMPEMNGFEVLEALRKNGTLRNLPVILISGLDSDTNAVRGIELGAEDFLPRPVDLKLLRARVHSAIERQRLREKELAAYFTPDLARYLLRHPEELTTGRQVEVSVVFCDIVGFSKVSENLGAARAIRWVGDTLSAMSRCVMDEAGVLVDYTGDEVMAMWGAPGDQPDHADRACRCAAAMQEALPEINAKWEETIGQKTEVAIGVNTGDAFVGNIGTPQKFKFGPLGNTVNLASRVQSATKFVRSRVLISGATRKRTEDSFHLRRIGKVRVINIGEPVDLHELCTGIGEKEKVFTKLRDKYEKSLALFEKGEFRGASALLGDLLLKYPDDGPSLLLMSRVVQEMLQDDIENFDPVWTLPGK